MADSVTVSTVCSVETPSDSVNAMASFFSI